MCGITGFINSQGEQAEAAVIADMTSSLQHRGPDGEGIWLESNVAIGHRRLSIIDHSNSAAQPMMSANHQFILSYNGELYNYKELRKELQELGFWFRSQSDTEVLLNAMLHWKEKALDKFNGMFAFALWDRKNQKLLLVRDRYGIKPLYYCEQDGLFLFGSEQKAILSHPKVKKQLDLKALYEYFTFQNIFTDRTFNSEIKMLPAGSYMEIDFSSGYQQTVNKQQYWDYDFHNPDLNLSYHEAVEELDFLMSRAIKRQMVSDVEVGAYLSGGMDSGTITALAAQETPYIKSFTCGFDLTSASGVELAYDERPQAEAMSALFRSEHYEMVLKSGDMERCLPLFARHLEEPRVGQSYPNYYAAQLASKFVKVVLSGAGGDELFGGYPWRYYRAAGSKNFTDFVDHYYLFWQRLMPNTVLQQLFKPVWQEVSDVWTRDIFESVFDLQPTKFASPEDCINSSLYFEAKTFLQGLFVVEDKLSMAHGLETRVPFMDNDLVEFAMRCPLDYKLHNLRQVSRVDENELADKKHFYRKTKEGKRILRDAMKNYIPEEITEGIKQGFSSPDSSWFKVESVDFVKNILFDKQAKIYKVMDQSVVTDIFEQHLSGKSNNRLAIWSFINLEHYLNEFGV